MDDVNCVNSVAEFREQTPMTKRLSPGTSLDKYTRYMTIDTSSGYFSTITLVAAKHFLKLTFPHSLPRSRATRYQPHASREFSVPLRR